MSDINPPTPPPSDTTATTAAPITPAAGGGATSTGLEPNVAAGIAAIFGWLGGLIFFFVEKKSTFVRFWAAQLVVLWLGILVLMIALSVVGAILGQLPGVGGILAILLGLLSLVIWLGCFALWIVTVIKTFTGKEWRIPFVADLADKMIVKFPTGA